MNMSVFEKERVGEGERESGFLTAHQHKNRPFSAIEGKNRIKWDNLVN